MPTEFKLGARSWLLLAAAPEMLDVIRRLYRTLADSSPRWEQDSELAEQVRQLLRKVEN